MSDLQQFWTYTALLALPNGEMARAAVEHIGSAAEVSVVDNEQAGVWLSWWVRETNEEAAIFALQEIRLRAEMISSNPDDGDPSLFQGTPFIIVKGDAEVVFSEEVYCI